MDDVYNLISEVLQDILDLDDVIARPDMTAADAEGWDSLANIRIFIALEKKFSIKFSAVEIGKFDNVGQIADAIRQKRGG
jgi:acyl carrier protein